ncbi:Uncharacterized protein Rs2_31321 [Raphanus sativus]|nr:Uncharacterized protein Rs2_31321 [Raphanus sativus]
MFILLLLRSSSLSALIKSTENDIDLLRLNPSAHRLPHRSPFIKRENPSSDSSPSKKALSLSSPSSDLELSLALPPPSSHHRFVLELSLSAIKQIALKFKQTGLIVKSSLIQRTRCFCYRNNLVSAYLKCSN